MEQGPQQQNRILLILGVLFFAIVIGVFTFSDQRHEVKDLTQHFEVDRAPASTASWKQFSKEKEMGPILQKDATPEDLEKWQINPNVVAKNKDVSKRKGLANLEGRPVLAGGQQFIKESVKLPNEIEFINNPNPRWEDLLGESLLRTFDPGAKVVVAHLDSFVSLEKYGQKTQARYVEQVIVNYALPDGVHTSFTALVDSQSGKVLSTWAQSVNENFHKIRLRQQAR